MDDRTVRFGPESTITVGRDPDSALAIEHPVVSRHHLSVGVEAGRWVVRDIGSANGSYVDGNRFSALTLDGPRSVRLGDAENGVVIHLAVEPRSQGLPANTQVGSTTVRIGRDPGNDIVVDELLVSRHHAELRSTVQGLEVVDLASHNGTFVNGRRVERALLALGDIVAVGLQRFEMGPGGLIPRGEARAVEFAALGLHVRLRHDGPVLLDGVSFALAPCSLLAVVGPSGSGKSTLVGALTGSRPATSGRVLYDGRDLYESLDELSGRMGMVPQDDILHPQLTVRKALEYGAELRFPPDTDVTERSSRVAEVLVELGLDQRADVVIGRLSGGQRKRVSVALELLTRPSLLFLDEPTSGLDPGTERSLMEQLRALADGGRTIVVVTHSLQSLHLCDRVLYLAPGGRMGWFGPPGGAPAFFACADEQEVFRRLADDPDGWPPRFLAHRDYQRFVVEPLAAGDPTSLTGIVAPAAPARAADRRVGGWWRQVATLSRRYVRVLYSDRRNLAILVLQAPFLGALLLAALPPGELKLTPTGQFRLVSKAPFVLFLIALAMTWLGASNAVREIAKELPILRRERAVGLSLSAYITSKFLVLGVVTVGQAVVLCVLALGRQHGPGSAIVLGWPLGEIMVAAAVTGLAALALGLLVSAVAKTPDRAMTVLPMVLVLEMVLAVGAIVPSVTDKPVLKQVSYLSSAQWGTAATGATAELNRLTVVNDLAKDLPTINLADPLALLTTLPKIKLGDPRFNHEPRAWWSAIAAILLLMLMCLIATWAVLTRDRGGP